MVSVVADGRMAYGIQLPVQSQSTLYAEPWEASAGAAELVAMAQAADRHGYLYVAVCDHVAIPERLAGAMSTVWYDTIATLGYLAAVTERVRLLSHIWIAPLRHPLLTAKAFATLDALSNGRVILGLGAGHVPEEFAALGVDFEGRGPILDDTIAALDALLRDEFATVADNRFAVEGLGQQPRPVQSPRPPIWVGGSSTAARRRAATMADGWLPQGDPRDAMRALIPQLREQRAAVRDDPMDIGAICEFLYVGDPDWDVGDTTLTGSPDKLAESLSEYAEMGVDQLQVRFRSRSVDELVDQMAAFGTEVAPRITA